MDAFKGNLIELVRINECLWNQEAKVYVNTKLMEKNKIWQKIADRLASEGKKKLSSCMQKLNLLFH